MNDCKLIVKEIFKSHYKCTWQPNIPTQTFKLESKPFVVNKEKLKFRPQIY